MIGMAKYFWVYISLMRDLTSRGAIDESGRGHSKRESQGDRIPR